MGSWLECHPQVLANPSIGCCPVCPGRHPGVLSVRRLSICQANLKIASAEQHCSIITLAHNSEIELTWLPDAVSGLATWLLEANASVYDWQPEAV